VRGLGPDDDPVRPLEVLDCGAFAQELGIGHDLDAEVRARLAGDALNLVAGADRNGGFRDDHQRASGCPRNGGCGSVDICQVGMAVAASRGRPHRQEYRFRIRDSRFEIGGKLSRPCLTFSSTSSFRPGSKMGIVPDCNILIFASSRSTHVTVWPKSDRHAPDTNPT